MEYKKLSYLLVFLFCFSFVFAQQSTLGIFKQGEDVVLTQGCIASTYSSSTTISCFFVNNIMNIIKIN